jgi:carbonic anhydrase
LRTHCAELTKGQHPFAIILTCSDSRIPTEVIFDTGFGDLFVVRVAGAVANPSSIASVEFAIAHLGTKLVVVMGHQNCGAVSAALESQNASKNLNHLISYIKPAIGPSEQDLDVDTVTRRSAQINAERLVKESDIIRRAVKNDGVKIVTAFFHFGNGKVEFD